MITFSKLQKTNVFVVVASFSLIPTGAYSQSYPTKPIHIIVSQPAGSGSDIEVRQLAPHLTKELGQPIVVDNRPGNATLLGMEAVSKASPDGYTLGAGAVTSLSSNPRLYDNAPYDVERLVPVSLILKHPWALYVNPEVGTTNFRDFIARAQAKPMHLTYATTGIGGIQHLSIEWLQQLTGTKLRHIPYGASPWVNDLLAGQVDSSVWPLITMVDHVKSGKLRALAISNESKRAEQLPEVPTFAEVGLPQFQVSAWAGIVAPAGTPKAIVEKLSIATAKAVRTKEFQDFTKKIGATAVGNAPEEFDAFMKSERARWKKVISDAGIRLID